MNVVADALIHKEPIFSYYLIRAALVEGLREHFMKDNVKVKQQVYLVEGSQGLETFSGRLRVHNISGIHDIVL